MDTSPHKSELVNVNGIRLHYLDWGGEGESLLFLTGMGSSAHIFDIIAPRFTDKFRVLALTRRGQGESDRPESGYDVDTLVDDILKFMHTLKIERTILAGHSLAGVELTCFTERHPEKVLKLVYLDAVYDAKGRMETFKRRPLNEIRPPEEKTEFSSVEEYIAYCKYIRPDLAQIWNETFGETAGFDLVRNLDGEYVERDTSSIEEQVLAGVVKYEPDHADIKVPVLSFVAIFDPVRPVYYTEEQKRIMLDFHRETWIPFQQEEIAKFKNDIPQAKVIEIHNSHHYCFISQEDHVYQSMKTFLSE